MNYTNETMAAHVASNVETILDGHTAARCTMPSGHVINIVRDDDPSSPFDNQSDPVPTLFSHGRSFHRDTDNRNVPDLPTLTRDQIIQTGNTFRGDLNYLQWSQRYTRDHRSAYADADTLISDGLESWVEDTDSISDRFERMATVYRAAGWPCVVTTLQGYSQGDWCDVLLVLTPDWLKATGCSADDAARIFDTWGDELAAYFYGDVYGFELIDPDGDHIDACYGFYGATMYEPGSDLWGHAIEMYTSMASELAGTEPGVSEPVVTIKRVPIGYPAAGQYFTDDHPNYLFDTTDEALAHYENNGGAK